MTEVARERLQSLLLNLLSTHRHVDPASVSALAPDDWQALTGMARQHRLRPLLHWRLVRERAGLPVPQSVRDELSADFRRSAMKALQMQRELLLVHRILDGVGIPHLALKGAYLAYHAYPHPALRPMRDLDILVPKEMALVAYRTLLEAGFSRSREEQGNLEAVLESRSHLPPLISGSTGVHIELHTRFSNSCIERDVRDLADDRLLWRRSIHRNVGSDRLSFLSPTDLLLHLIEHAVYRHQFDNGPLVLSDLACLIEGHRIDWGLFWQRAELCSLSRGTVLLIKLVEHYFGPQSVEWPEAVSPGAATRGIVEAAALLTLRDVTSRRDVKLESRILGRASLRGKFGFLLRTAFPARRKLATLYPVPENSLRIYFWYFVRWRYYLTVRLPEYLASRKKHSAVLEARRIFQLEQWLQEQ